MSLGINLSLGIAALILMLLPLYSAHAISPTSTPLDRTGSPIEVAPPSANTPLVIASFLEEERRPIGRSPLTLEGNEKNRSSWALYLDNDLFALASKDRDYTGGVALTLS